MSIVPVTSWEEFEQKISELNKNWSEEKRKKSPLIVSDLLFRGQPVANDDLKTTLERYFKPLCSMDEYYKAIHAAKHRIETFTERKWSIPTVQKYREWLGKYDPDERGKFLAYEYMAYLRHHSFPSPLLDWTMSPFVAAYFAFRDTLNKSDAVAVFSYAEYTGEGKSSIIGEPYIRTLGPQIRTHKRHFLQQSKYTICTASNDHGPYYASHQEVFNRNREDQDLLRKFIIPATERAKALSRLDSYNINAHSLFGSEESLMEIIAMREFILKKTGL